MTKLIEAPTTALIVSRHPAATEGAVRAVA
jgi:hypothetical protein